MNIIEKLLGQGPRIEKQLRKEEKYYVGDVIIAYDDKGLFAEAFISNKQNTKMKNILSNTITEVNSCIDLDSKIRSIIIKQFGAYQKLYIERLNYCIKKFRNFRFFEKYLTKDGELKNKTISVEELIKVLNKIKMVNAKIYIKEQEKNNAKKTDKNPNKKLKQTQDLTALSEKTRDF